MSVEDDGSIYVLETTGPLAGAHSYDASTTVVASSAVETAEPTSSQIRIETGARSSSAARRTTGCRSWWTVCPHRPRNSSSVDGPVGAPAGVEVVAPPWERDSGCSRRRPRRRDGLARDEHDAACGGAAGRAVGQRVVVVVRVYDDSADEFVVLVLGRNGRRHSASRSTRRTGPRRPRSVGSGSSDDRCTGSARPRRSVRRPLRPGGALMLTPRRLVSRVRPRVRARLRGPRPRTTRASSRTTATTRRRRRRRTSPATARPRSLCALATRATSGRAAAGTTTTATTRRATRARIRTPAARAATAPGFTFKVWREALDTSDAGFQQWGCCASSMARTRPLRSRRGSGAPNVTVPKSGLVKMDALASDGHIGLIYAVNPDGSDQIIEAKGEAYGTNIWTRTYRGARATAACGDRLELVTPTARARLRSGSFVARGCLRAVRLRRAGCSATGSRARPPRSRWTDVEPTVATRVRAVRSGRRGDGLAAQGVRRRPLRGRARRGAWPT